MSENIKWSSNTYFILAVLCYTISLPTIETFSVDLIKINMGCLVGIILLLVMVILVIPCRLMEFALGQYSNKASIKVWDICPFFRGVGWNGIVYLIIQVITQHVHSSRILLYAVTCFQRQVPWESCNETWIKGECYELEDYYAHSLPCGLNYTYEQCDEERRLTSMQHYWFYRIIKHNRTDQFAGLNMAIVYCGFFTSAVVFWATYKGPKSIQKALWILFVVPTLELLLLFFSSLIDAGGVEGIEHFFSPNFGTFWTWSAWIEVLKIFVVTSGIGSGVYVTFGTHCSFRNSLYLKVILISLGQVILASLYALTMENFMGIFCHYTGISIEEFKTSKKSFLGVKTVSGLHYMHGYQQFWAFLWFSGIYLVGLRGLIVITSILIDVFYNSVPKAQRYPTLTALAFCVSFNLLSLVLCTTRHSMAVFHLLKNYSWIVITFLDSVQVMAVVIFYGASDFMDDVHFMLGIRPPFYYNIYYVVSLVLFSYVHVTFSMDYYADVTSISAREGWPRWMSNGLIWCSYLVMVGFMVKHVVKAVNGGFCWKVFNPDQDWGPRHLVLRKSRMIFTSHHITREYMYRQERRRRHLIDLEEHNMIE